MRTYKAEQDAGIDLGSGRGCASVSASVEICSITDSLPEDEITANGNGVQTVEDLLGQEQPDLALVVAILVSTGWNLNDDIFIPAEVWRARSSPLHKPMNDNHDCEKILGHIVRSRALDKNGDEVVVDSTDDLPSEFDLEVAGVLYKAFPELSDRINEILDEAKAGKMFVSMEAWFPDFGYGLVDPSTGETKLVERTEDTSFLTKHLRFYGGSGQYNGYRIGRVLKDIVFGAQGFVTEPANPDSVIKVAACKAVASNSFVTANLSDLPEGGVENVSEQLKELQEKLEAAQADLKAKDEKIAELSQVVADTDDKDYAGQIDELTAKVEELTATVAETSSDLEAVRLEKDNLQTQLDEAVSRAEKSEAELCDIRKDELARERLAKLAAVKSVEDEGATLAELRDMTPETFDVVLKYAGETKADTTTSEAEPVDDDADRAEAALDEVKEEADANLNVSEDVVENEKTQWMSVANALFNKDDKQDEGGE